MSSEATTQEGETVLTERQPMATVEQAMSSELFAVSPAEPVEHVLRYLLLLGLTGAPVVDDEGKPVGMLSLRDVLTREGETVGERMSAPVVMIWAGASLEDAVHLLCDTGHHRLVVVDQRGIAVGMLSSLDVVRAMAGRIPTHPNVRADFDERTGLLWTEDERLDWEHVHHAPQAPGIFLLLERSRDGLDRVAWIEAADDIRARLMDLVLRRASRPLPIASAIERGALRFRAALEPNAAAREQRLAELVPSSIIH